MGTNLDLDTSAFDIVFVVVVAVISVVASLVSCFFCLMF